MPFNFSTINFGEVLGTLDKIQTIKTLRDFQAQQPAMVKAIADLKSNLTAQETEINTLNATLNQNQQTITSLQSANTALTQDNAAKAAAIEDLTRKLAAVAAPPKMQPLDLARSFKNVVDQIQQDARQASGVAATTIKSMAIEIKGLVNVDGANPVMVLPTPGSAIDPGQLSTLQISFGAVPMAVPAPLPPKAETAGGRSEVNLNPQPFSANPGMEPAGS